MRQSLNSQRGILDTESGTLQGEAPHCSLNPHGYVISKNFFWKHSNPFVCTGLFIWHESHGSAARFGAASFPRTSLQAALAAGGSGLLRQQGQARVPALWPTAGSCGGAPAKLT